MTVPEYSQAAVFHVPHQPFDLRQVRIPQLRDGELLVRVEACTVCGSDLHTVSGRRSTPVPSILGHEILARLVWPDRAIDGAGKQLRAGERLVWSLAGSCNNCFFCRAAIPQKCTSLFKYGHERFEAPWPLNGGLAEYCTLRAGTFYVGIRETLETEVVAPASCATATVAAVIRAAGDIAGKQVLVLGAGMLGLTACAMLDSLGAKVVVADVNPHRLQMAFRFGAGTIVDGRRSCQESLSEVREVTGGYGADVVLELAGVNSSVERALLSTRVGGVCVLAGSVFPQDPISISAEDIVRRMITIRGVHNYAPADLVQALEFLSTHAHRYPFQTLVEAEFPLRKVDEAFRYAAESAPYRIAVKPEVQ